MAAVLLPAFLVSKLKMSYSVSFPIHILYCVFLKTYYLRKKKTEEFHLFAVSLLLSALMTAMGAA